ncbi:MAG: hypothetical protein R2746_09610 [Acidimicrobiales bacterium]
MDFEVVQLGDGTVDVVARHANLPEGTQLEVSATRSFSDGRGHAAQGVVVGHESTEVAIGMWAATISIDHGELTGLSGGAGAAIETVSPVIAMCAEVRTGRDSIDDDYQWDDEARVALGPHGKNLARSEGAVVVDGKTGTPATWLRAQRDVEMPPPLDEIAHIQGTRPRVAPIDTFCA